MGKPWKLVLCLIGIFLAGAVTGGLATWRVIRIQAQKRMMPGQWGPERMRRYVSTLNLTLDQQDAIRPIVNRAAQQLSAVRLHSLEEFIAIQDRMVAQVEMQLTPDQRATLEAQHKREREHFNRWAERHFRHYRPPGEESPHPVASPGRKPGPPPAAPAADKSAPPASNPNPPSPTEQNPPSSSAGPANPLAPT